MRPPLPHDETPEDAPVGRYRLIAPLGQGGMARVHLASASDSPDSCKLLVVKELRAELAHDPEFVAMVVDEGRLAVRLNHGNVVQTYEAFSDGRRHGLVMEFLDGQPLAAVIARLGARGVPLEAHVRIIADVLAGLHYAHELCDYDGTPLGVVHRDVSPQNVFLTYDGRVKLVDFGIAKGALSSSSTRAGEFKGKLAYAPPEQLLGEPVTRAADIFSAGLMLWEALTGERAGAGETAASLLHRRIVGDEPAPRLRRPEVPEALDAICRRATARRPEDRFATAADFAQALDDYLGTLSRRPGPRDLAALVGPPFEAERAALRKTIDAFFRTSSQRHAITSEHWAMARPGFSSEGEPTLAGPLAGGPSEGARPSRRSTAAARWLLGGAALTLAALAPLAWRAAPLASAPAHAAAPPAASPAPPAAGFVEVRVRARPDGARVALDGVDLGEAPFAGRFPRDGRTHRLDVAREGHEPESRLVVFDQDVDLALALPPTSPAAGAAPAREGKPGRARPPSAARPPPPKPTIDTRNPYG